MENNTKLHKIDKVMFCWNDETKKVGLMKNPSDMNEIKQNGFNSRVVVKPWMDKKDKIIAFLTEGFWLIKYMGLKADEVFDTLNQIEEIKSTIERDPFLE